MAEIDFSKLEAIAYPGISGAEAKARKDALIEQGFRYVDEKEYGGPSTPTTAPEPDTISSRDYRPIYRATFDFHKRHSPPVVDEAFWRTHDPHKDDPPESEQTYWRQTIEDLAPAEPEQEQDPFLTGLLSAVLSELDREYKRRRDQAAATEKIS